MGEIIKTYEENKLEDTPKRRLTLKLVGLRSKRDKVRELVLDLDSDIEKLEKLLGGMS